MNYTIRLTDPNQPSHVYTAAQQNLPGAKKEAKELEKGVLIGGTVEIFEGLPSEQGDRDPVVAWTVEEPLSRLRR